MWIDDENSVIGDCVMILVQSHHLYATFMILCICQLFIKYAHFIDELLGINPF